MEFDIKQHTIFLTLTGSRVYGTFDEHSDYDYRGVAIPPRRYFLGCQARFEQHESSTPDDTVVYGINKFLRLASDNNPNVMELLFIPARFWATSSPEWAQLVQHRDWFLCTRSFHRIRGYAFAQLKRVRSHRSWLLQGELKLPTRADFGLPPEITLPKETLEAASDFAHRFLGQERVEEQLSNYAQHDKAGATILRQQLFEFVETATGLSRPEMEDRLWAVSTKALGYETDFQQLLSRERQYRQAKRHYNSWLAWKAERNEARKVIEARCGYDAKHMQHVFRILGMGKEILTTGTMLVTRPDADFLRDIRGGKFKFEELEQLYAKQDAELETLYQTSTLQAKPKINEIEQLGIELVEQFLRRFA
jgi:hypothetical protein